MLIFILSKERKERKKMSILEKELPEYHHTMYLEGYTPTEILFAAHKTIYNKHLDRQSEEEFAEVKITTEVKK